MAVQRMKLQILVMIILTFLSITWLGVVWWFSGNPFVAVRAGAPARPAMETVIAIPHTFSYQGILRAADGSLVNDTVDITLNLYNVVTGGTALHSESFIGVNVRDGIFGVVVGDATPIGATVFDNATLYIGIRMNSDDEMLPRQRLHPVPWAMQASTAQTAVTANELIQGGGVPGVVSFGIGGASEIAFTVHDGKITNSATGMTITGGANKTVTTEGALSVGGDLTVAGDWSTGAILDKGDSNGGVNQRSTYPVSINRYVVEAPDNGTAPDTVPVDDAILRQLCQDEDGCTIHLALRDWNDSLGRGLLANYGPFRFSLSEESNGTRYARIQDSHSGTDTMSIDGDGTSTHLLNIYNACYLTDTTYSNGIDTGDSALGFALLNWHGGGYDSLDMTCVLIIED